MLFLDLLVKHRTVKIPELAFDEHWQVHTSREVDSTVVRGLNATLARQREHVQLLRTVSIHSAQSDGEHKLGGLKSNLEGTKKREPESGLLLQVYFGDKEPHPLLNVAPEDPGGASRDRIAILSQPGL